MSALRWRLLFRSPGSRNSAAIVVQGPHHDIVFRDNTIGNSKPGERPTVGILTSPEARNLQAAESQFQNVKTPIEVRK